MKQRYDLNSSVEVWKLYQLIKDKGIITFQELENITNKNKGSLSDQLKPLTSAKIVLREGSGKRGHPATYRLINTTKYACPCCGKVI
jgi:predicted HTH transcriptional regulator